MDALNPEPQSYEDLARILEYPLLDPNLTEESVHRECQRALDLGLAAVIVRPTDSDLAVRVLAGTSVAPASVVSWPGGIANTSVKQYEARDLLRRGIRELSTAVNSGKMISRQFPYLENELLQLVSACRETGADLSTFFEFPAYAEDLRLIACKIVRRTEVTFAAPWAGLDSPSTHADLTLMRARCASVARMKAWVPTATLDEILALHAMGCERIVTTTPTEILGAWKRVLEERAAKAAVPPPS